MIMMILVYMGVRLLPIFNEERKVWGSFNYEYLENWFYEYNIGNQESGEKSGRLGGNILVFENLNRLNTKALLFGFGPDQFVNANVRYEKINAQKEVLGFNLEGTMKTGVVKFVLSIGLFGVITYLYFMLSVMRSLFLARIADEAEGLVIHFSILALMVLFFLDFATYSSAMTSSKFFAFVIFVYLGSRLNAGSCNMEKC
jgi:hypothetical protein